MTNISPEKINTFLLHMLPSVEKPVRYTGGEYNSQYKSLTNITLRIALCYPDLYEIGMSNQSLKILYHMLNQEEHFYAERVFTPAPDFEQLLIEHAIPLHTLETKTPLSAMDIIGFTIQYELVAVNILTILSLSNIPLFQNERNNTHPLIIGGGPAMANPEPFARYFDVFYIGDAEAELINVLHTWEQSQGKSREQRLQQLTHISGIYVPSLNISSPKQAVQYAGISELPFRDYPTAPIVPNTNVIQDRVVIETTRGCTHGCRFCQAGYWYRPLRERPFEDILRLMELNIANTGFKEINLSSLSISDYSMLFDLVRTITAYFKSYRINISLPSLRIDTFSSETAREIAAIRKSGLTFALEGGSETLRLGINKPIQDAELLSHLNSVIQSGWRTLKVYFMFGFPNTDPHEEAQALINSIRTISDATMQYKRKPTISIHFSPLIPKPLTPLQWSGQASLDVFKYIKDAIMHTRFPRHIKLKWPNFHQSLIEAVIARGDRNTGFIIYKAWKQGARLDGWSDYFNWHIWENVFTENKLNALEYAAHNYRYTDILPWEHIHHTLDKKYLWKEFENYKNGILTANCINNTCSQCGICNTTIKNSRTPKPTSHTIEHYINQHYIKPYENKKSGRLRIMYNKIGLARFMSHRDMMVTFERLCRRTTLPLYFSEGFNPHPKIVFSEATATGIEIYNDIVEVILAHPVDVKKYLIKMNDVAPMGIEITSLTWREINTPTISKQAVACVYEIYHPAVPVYTNLNNLLEHTPIITVIGKDKSKSIDLRQFKYFDFYMQNEKAYVHIPIGSGIRITSLVKVLWQMHTSDIIIRRINVLLQNDTP